MTTAMLADSGPTDSHDLDDLCRIVFESISRSDQRRWATAYVRGLVHVPGRKSVRRISELVAGGSNEQCLQQFVNQSPWQWAPVRRMLAAITEPAIAPRAWVAQELDFPKRGRSSVGVATQYVAGARRTFNCQLGIAMWMAGDRGAVPLNWRLLLPQVWDTDAERRKQVRLPESERCRPAWEQVLACLDEMTECWDLTPRPVVADRRHDPQADQLIRGLDERGLAYAVRVAETTPVVQPGNPRALVRAGDLRRTAAAHQLVAFPERPLTRRRSGGVGAPLIAHLPAAVPGVRPTLRGPARPRRLLVHWPRGSSGPVELWLTNLALTPLPAVLDLLDMPERLSGHGDRMRQECGLDHFEGRSYPGWHHHVTLASVAHAHHALADRSR